jgi:hypothetical protein
MLHSLSLCVKVVDYAFSFVYMASDRSGVIFCITLCNLCAFGCTTLLTPHICYISGSSLQAMIASSTSEVLNKNETKDDNKFLHCDISNCVEYRTLCLEIIT